VIAKLTRSWWVRALLTIAVWMAVAIGLAAWRITRRDA